jgi:hypothetical protein
MKDKEFTLCVDCCWRNTCNACHDDSARCPFIKNGILVKEL